MLGPWISFFQGELGAAAALAGLLFVSMSVNQTKILELGRMADRGLEALAILFVVIIVSSLPLIPGQPPRLVGGEILFAGAGGWWQPFCCRDRICLIPRKPTGAIR